MNPMKLTLNGFAGIFSGQKKESITLELDGTKGPLIALVGPNGAGKSTIMDNLHPYRLMPSRAGSYSPNAFSFYDQLSGDEGSKELIWEHAGQTYRSLLQFQAGKRRKTEAYLFVLVDEEWQPAHSRDGQLTSDGKTDNYDKVLESLLGSPETFFTSVFSAQGKKPLSTYGNAEIKGLMAELLGLDSIKELGKKASQVKSLLAAELSQQQSRLGQAHMAQASKEAALEKVAAMEGAIAELQSAKVVAHQRLREAEQRLAEITAQIQQSEAVIQRQHSLKQSKASLDERLHKLQSQQAQKAQQLKAGYAQEVANLDRDIADDEKSIHTAQQELEKLQNLEKQADEIRQAVSQEQEIQSKLTALQKAIESQEAALSERLSKKRAIHEALLPVTQELAQMKAQGENLSHQKTAAERQASLIHEVPCAGMDLAQKCPLLAEANLARQKIQPFTIQLAELRVQYRSAKEAVEAQRAEWQAIADDDPELSTMKTQAKALQQTLDTLRPLVMQASLLEQSGVQKQQWESSLSAKMREQQEKSNKKAILAEQLKMALAALATEVQEESKTLEDEQRRISTELEAIVLPDFSSKADAESAYQLAHKTLDDIEQTIQSQQNKLVDAKAQVQILDAKTQDMSHIEAVVTRLGSEMEHWNKLIKALGNDGIIALSIDDVGPTLSAYANDLLMACYGPRFTLSIQTQTTNAKGEEREGFDITVFDADTQDSKSVEKMSGGERVWINEAMTRAIALFLAKESGQAYATLFTDEADGALDPDRKRRFMQMKREVLKLGGYQREYFVSQTPELWEMADSIIDVTRI